MTDEIVNVLVVRFSLVLNEDWLRKVYGAPSNREAWLKYRLNIFNQTLRPSIIAQTKKPSAVYLLLDSQDENFYLENCSDLEGIFIPVFSRAGVHYAQVGVLIKETARRNVAVSRGDSDDILSFDYFAEINRVISRHKQGKSLLRVVACSGYRTNGVRIQEVYSEVSPFLTLFFDCYEGENIYAFNHGRIREMSYVKNREARWIQFIHGSNISNRFIETSNSKQDLEHKIVFNPESSVFLGTRLRWLIPARYPTFVIPAEKSSWSMLHKVFADSCSLLTKFHGGRVP
jgi:hypothetical protein